MKISVDENNGQGLSLCAPLVHNSNDSDTAFGGILYCIAVTSSWC